MSTEKFFVDPQSFDAAALFYDIDYRERPDLEFWVKHIPRWGRSILEVGCGTGRILAALLAEDTARALTLDGFDISGEMVAIARKRTGLQNLLVADMRDFSALYEGTFECVAIPFNSLMHLANKREWEVVFKQCRHVMAGGGLLAFSVLNPNLEEWDADGTWEQEKDFHVELAPNGLREAGAPGGSGAIRYRKWYRKEISPDEEGLLHITFAFLPKSDGEPKSDVQPGAGSDGLPRVCFRFPLRYAYPSEIMEMLYRSGFEMVHLWGDWDEASADEDSETLVFVARGI